MLLFAGFGALDQIALAVVLLSWFSIGWFIEHPPAGRPSVSLLMQAYRREWMQQFLTRQPRIFDASMIDSLRQSTAFFASASMIAIGGAIAMIGNPAAVRGVAADLTLSTESLAIELRVLLVVGFLANALLKFIWSHRLFGYCSIMMAAVPNDPADPMAAPRAAHGVVLAAEELHELHGRRAPRAIGLGAGGHAEAPDKPRHQIRKDVAKQIAGDHYVELLGCPHQLH